MAVLYHILARCQLQTGTSSTGCLLASCEHAAAVQSKVAAEPAVGDMVQASCNRDVKFSDHNACCPCPAASTYCTRMVLECSTHPELPRLCCLLLDAIP
jgi:hypothetical protein